MHWLLLDLQLIIFIWPSRSPVKVLTYIWINFFPNLTYFRYLVNKIFITHPLGYWLRILETEDLTEIKRLGILEFHAIQRKIVKKYKQFDIRKLLLLYVTSRTGMHHFFCNKDCRWSLAAVQAGAAFQ